MVDGKLTEVELEGCADCGNTAGTFKIISGKRYCAGKCAPFDKPRSSKGTFPFTTSNFDGKPVEVQSLRHLRKLESAHGVHCAPYAWNANNLDR